MRGVCSLARAKAHDDGRNIFLTPSGGRRLIGAAEAPFRVTPRDRLRRVRASGRPWTRQRVTVVADDARAGERWLKKGGLDGVEGPAQGPGGGRRGRDHLD